MHLESNRIIASATDVAAHLACPHLTTLEHAAARGERTRPASHDPRLEVLRRRGFDHENRYISYLRESGRQIVELRDVGGADAVQRTRRAAVDGADVIVQAAMTDGHMSGRADVLLKTKGESDLGGFVYEVADTKLAQETMAGTVLQLAAYADLLATLQGRPAPRMHVVMPGANFPTETFRFEQFAAYYRAVRARLQESLLADPAPATEPEPVPHCDVCRWWSICDARRRREDHLSLVAGMSRLHSGEFRRQGVRTLAALGERSEPLAEPPRRGRRDTYVRLRDQAAIQLRGRGEDAPLHELLPHEPGRGLAVLPAPSTGDVYLDFEGDPHVDAGGLEYLLGFARLDDGGKVEYEGRWAVDRSQEKAAFESFVDFVRARLERYPDLHVYHFAPYEPAALKRLASRHATRENELDELLRARRFIDLHAVTRQGLRASVESYSLKKLEAFLDFRREVDLREEASPALRRVECALELGVPVEITPADRASVEGYNRDDCISLVHLQRWLEERRRELVASGVEVTRPPLSDGATSGKREERNAQIAALYDTLVEGVHADPKERSEEQRARWLLAHLLEYYARETRVGWWEYHARRDAEDEDLVKDRKAAVGLAFQAETEPGRGAPVHRYRMPDQEVSLHAGDKVHDARADITGGLEAAELGKVHGIDLAAGTIDIKKTGKTKDRHPRVIHAEDSVPAGTLVDALHATARAIATEGLDAEDPTHRAARDLLLGRPPRRGDTGSPLRAPDEELLAAQLRVARDLHAGVLAVQGPPGTGKSWTGARVIRDLAREGKRIGVCAVSHKVVRSLLEKVLEASREDGGRPLEATHKIGSKAKPDPAKAPPGLAESQDNAAALAALDEGHVVGGVAWLWASADAADTLDTLFVDEAGQMALAQVLSALRSARNLVLLGDPQQLQQPQRGAHPEGAETSALGHLLQGAATIPESHGIFLDRTWRLHPAICDYTSELFYEGRRQARANLKHQSLAGPTRFAGNGLFFVPVPHEGNQAHAPEEVARVRAIVADLLQPGCTWTAADGSLHPLQESDILVVAPYNLQVTELARALPPGVPVGTVDRFQGQEAPVVIYSLASSSAADAPRGLSFLYDPHRLNVATSRARCVCILVGSPRLLEPECRTPEQMRRANGLCSYVERATWVRCSAS